MLSDIDTFLATLAGAAVAGAVGILTLLVQQWLDSRRRLREEVIGPALDFLIGLPRECQWRYIGEMPWAAIEPHRWLAVPRRYRHRLDRVTKSLREYDTASSAYNNLANLPEWADFDRKIRYALAKYLEGSPPVIPAARVGIEGAASIQVSFLSWILIPTMLVNDGRPEEAWNDLIERGPADAYWAKEVFKHLRVTDAPACRAVFDGVNSAALADRARDSAQLARTRYRASMVEVSSARDAFAGALSLKRALHEGP